MDGFKRPPLRTLLREELIRRHFEGRLQPDERISVAKLAKSIGVSRTPIREALIQLEVEGFVVSEPEKGFTIQVFSRDEIGELYALVGSLEAWALEHATELPGSLLTELKRLDQTRKEVADKPFQSIGLDMEWHRTLSDATGSEHLRDVLRLLRLRLYRYEFEFAKDAANVRRALEDHGAVVQELEEGHFAQAGAFLRDHWERGAEAIMEAGV